MTFGLVGFTSCYLYFTVFTFALVCFDLAGSEVVLSVILAVDRKRVSAVKTATVLGLFVAANHLLPPGLHMGVLVAVSVTFYFTVVCCYLLLFCLFYVQFENYMHLRCALCFRHVHQDRVHLAKDGNWYAL